MKIKPKYGRLRTLGLGAALTTALLVPSRAGIFTNNFNADPGAAVALTGNAAWVANGGVAGSGFISITDAVNTQQGTMVLPDLDPGQAIGGFKADFMIRIGGGTARPADGVAFVFGPEVDESANFGEEGVGSGLVLSFDTWDNNGSDTAPAIDVKVGGVADANIVSTTYLTGQREGGRAYGGTILKDAAGNNVALDTGNEFVPVSIQVKDGLLNVFYKGIQLVKDVVVPFAAVPGRFAFGGRTGNANEAHWIDDFRVETFPLTAPSVVGFTGSPTGFSLKIQDSPNSAVTASSISATFNGTATGVAATKAGNISSLNFTSASVLAPGSTNTVVVTYAHGTTGIKATNTLTFVVGTYTRIPAAAALPAASVDKTKKGFTWAVHKLDGADMANTTARTLAQLNGLLGDNVADPAAVGAASGPGVKGPRTVDPITFIIPNVINLDQLGGSNGNAQPDEQMPGIPGINGGDQNIAAEIFTALEFPTAGLYTMIVNSDDGFATSAGMKNSRDAFTPVAGTFEGGRGATDSRFQVYVDAPGIYTFRTIWEEGGGGANIEWLSVLADGTPVLINDPANPAAIKAYQVPAAAVPAYVKSISPAMGVKMINRPKSVEVVLSDAGTTITANSAVLKLNGQTVTTTATKTGADTKLVYNVVGDLLPNTKYTAELTYADSAGSRTVTWDFTTGALSSTIFVVESEDFDYDGGLSNPKATEAGLNVNVMPYLGGAYDTLSAIEHIDFVNNDGPDSDFYRTEVGDDGDHEVNIAAANAIAGGNGLGGTISIGSNDRGAFTLNSNYRIGWVEGGSWQNYTRRFPTNGTGGWWKVYAALSFDGNVDGQLSGSLDVVKSGWGTVDQTVERAGDFGAPGSGGWGLNNLVAMKTASGAEALVKLNGTNTVRFNLGSGDFDFLIFSAAPPPPPFVDVQPADSVKRNEVILDFSLKDTDTKVNAATIKLAIDGTDVTSKITSAKTDTGATIHFDNGTNMVTAGIHNWTISFTDTSTPPQNVSVNGTFVVNPYPTEGVFTIEAEDFNYSLDGVAGGLTNPKKGEADNDVDVMPYNGGAYDQLSAVENIDYVNNDGNDSLAYRTELDENGENEVNITSANGARFSNDRGVFTLANNYRIGWVEGGSWQNYTRTVPTNNYNIWAALSFDGRAAGQLNASLDLVTSDPTKINQSTSRLGTFSAAGSGGWGRNELVPMKDTAGAIANVKLGGVKTFRFNLGSGDFDYFLLVPAPDASAPKFTSVKMGTDGKITVEWTGGGTLEAAPAVTGPWTAVTGATSPYTFSPTGKMLFGRIKK